ncbi:MAG TPA: hypothetical protein PK040_09490 [Anaerolineaceae bacterium]|nr:hypothetical protein [Anaerolineaceae bacterium]
MEKLAGFLLPGTLFILTLLLGFWLKRLARPYNGLLFNAHKLIALLVVVLTVIQFVRLLQGSPQQAVIIILLVVAALCVIVLFGSGAMMSAEKLDFDLMRTFHNIAPIILVITLALLINLVQ